MLRMRAGGGGCPCDNVIEVNAPPPHWKKLECAGCGKFHGFSKKPGSMKRRTKTSLRLAYVDYCQLCLRPRDMLAAIGRELTGHHVIEHRDGGSDEQSNIWTLCVGCHQLVHWMRTYVGRNSPSEDGS